MYWTGVLEGFQGRREQEYEKNFREAQANRQMADRVFSYLLQSRDPELQQFALQGLMQPVGRKKGFKGFMGEVDPGAQPMLDQIIARINEQVPMDGGSAMPTPTTPTPSAGPGSAAMSANAPVRPGSAPIPLDAGIPIPEEPTILARDLGETGDIVPEQPGGPPLGPLGAAGPPPPSQFKRRGTGVPTAEEIAEMEARAAMRGRIETAREALIAAGASPQEIEDAIMGIVGAPRPSRTLSTVTQWGVKLPGSDIVVPVLLDQERGYVTAGGQPLPPGAQMVRMSGSSAGGSLTSSVQDSEEARMQLLAMGADPGIISRGTATGYWRVRQGGDGSMLVMPGEYSPPPAYSGTGTFADESGVEVRGAIPREGGAPVILGDAPSQVDPQLKLDAQAIREMVDAEIRLRQSSTLGRITPIQPAERDQMVQRFAQTRNLPWTTYAELIQVIEGSTPITQRERVGGGTIAEQVLREAMRARQQGGGAPATSTLPPPPPGNPAGQPARSTGPGPRR